VHHRVPLGFAQLVQFEQLGRGHRPQHRGVDRLVAVGNRRPVEVGQQRAKLRRAPLRGRRGRVVQAIVALVVNEIGRLDRTAVERGGQRMVDDVAQRRGRVGRGQLISTLVT
jgi:hypothetical protein